MTMQTGLPAPNPEAAQRFIERAEQQRDLRAGIDASLGADEEKEFQFYEWSPGRTYVTLWSMEDGSKHELPRYMAEGALYLVGRDGKPRFTAFQDKAPQARANDTKCFLHPDSPMRDTLNELGIAGFCTAATLANDSAMWQHAQSRHSAQLRQYREEMDRREARAAREEQRAYMQTIANLAADKVEPKRGKAGGE